MSLFEEERGPTPVKCAPLVGDGTIDEEMAHRAVEGSKGEQDRPRIEVLRVQGCVDPSDGRGRRARQRRQAPFASSSVEYAQVRIVPLDAEAPAVASRRNDVNPIRLLSRPPKESW